MVSVVVYIPESHLQKVKEAMFAAGGGKIGNYDSCCWQTEGRGQFRPLENSKPYLGQKGVVKTVVEMKVEMACEREKAAAVIAAMKAVHPYETPAYHVMETLSF